MPAAEIGSLHGLHVALTGRLASMTHGDAVALIENHGGLAVETVTPQTGMLVVGAEGWPLKSDGHITHKLRQARVLQADGCKIEIVPEEGFLERLGLQELGESICRRYTLPQLTRILGIRPERLRTWMRAGLLEPVATVHRLQYFEFQQVSRARMLAGLTEAGVSPRTIRRQLDQLRVWIPDVNAQVAQFARFEQRSRLVVRTDTGRLAESHGQLLMEFGGEEVGQGSCVPLHVEPHPDDLFEQALAFGDAGRHDAAERVYRRILTLEGPDPEICFNLGNALFAQGRREAAVERFREAVELDPDYVEAWNNLGNVLSEADRHSEALEALQQAITLDPDYADSHFNLAAALTEAGRFVEARPHWESFLKHDSDSDWAEHARTELTDRSF